MCVVLVRRRRLAWALGGSLLLHGVGLAVVWKGAMPGAARLPPGLAAAPSPPAMLWVAVETPPSTLATAGGNGARLPARQAGARAVTVGATQGMAKSLAMAGQPSRRESSLEPGAGGSSSVIAVAPAAPASGSLPVPGPDDVARALARERAWQRQQRPADMLQPGQGGGVHDRRGADGARTAQVAGPWGSYCVEIPSSNQPPSMGAAPRIAPPSTCR